MRWPRWRWFHRLWNSFRDVFKRPYQDRNRHRPSCNHCEDRLAPGSILNVSSPIAVPENPVGQAAHICIAPPARQQSVTFASATPRPGASSSANTVTVAWHPIVASSAVAKLREALDSAQRT